MQSGAHQAIVLGVVDAGEAGNARPAKVDDAGVAQVVDVGRRPAAIVQLPEVVGRLVVAPDCAARIPNKFLLSETSVM